MTQIKISGERLINRKVKSFDGRDLGKIQSITPEYIELKEGNKRYFVPKVHVKEFDKDDLFVLLMEDEIKQKYEREDPPLKSEILEAERSGEGYTSYHEVIPFMAKEPGVQLKGEKTGTTINIPWEDVIHKHVRAKDDVDIGDVDRVGNEFIVVREGVGNVHLYYIPKQYITNYDGSSLWIDVASGLVSPKFEREHEPTREEIDMLLNEVPD
ncbi:MAG TPA: hypothetical protein VJ772_03235 [Nitrososphaeraceae archaeon]|jgi:hypothetical protein|nr:hypothetical protein [Nitrososphaeraceae archaeon]